jgi:4-aminobutyrate aminotransferase-like enzyme
LQAEHPDVIGDIRGQGLLWTIDIIKDRLRRLPSPRIATNLMIMLKDDKILIGTTGEFRNILLFSPPLCFTVENCTT